jgi:hypothetical protein
MKRLRNNEAMDGFEFVDDITITSLSYIRLKMDRQLTVSFLQVLIAVNYPPLKA